ncbi:response regulator transcription factor [Paenibacillaceae bacterium WGS1546]|uniref:response regulator transcription factor n=1 Tax=Cohnella sp. WGS1546 TaxID=3366810 RepID=UPI00372D6B2C
MPNEKILIVDDEKEISDLLALFLREERFEVLTTDQALEVADLVVKHQPALIILDIVLPDHDGLTICRQVRQISQVPILFISCKREDADIIKALGVGGDDYMVKPFNPSQLVARVKAHLRRTYEFDHKNEKADVLEFAGLKIDLGKRQVVAGGRDVVLSNKEYDILVALARQPERIFSYDELHERVWATPSMGDYRSLMVHIRHLRQKLEEDPTHPAYVQNIRGIGYSFKGKAAASGDGPLE